MARIGLIDVDGKLVNLALMKLSTYHKRLGDTVVLNPLSPEGLDRTYVSLIFTKSRQKAIHRYSHFPNVSFGGTGYSLTTTLPPEVEGTPPDYDLYSVEDVYNSIKQRPGSKESIWEKAAQIQGSGIGFTTRGCPRKCSFCAVPTKEGALHQVGTISDIVNPSSRMITILDNNFTSDPLCIPKLIEIKQRGLIVNLTQGIDVRLVTDEIAKALSEVQHWGSLHYAWDLTQSEKSVFDGIKLLSNFVKRSNHMCYVLTGFDTSFEEDVYRVTKLVEQGIRPYIMLYQDPTGEAPPQRTEFEQKRLSHFKRWINLPKAIYKKVPFAEFQDWINAQAKLKGAHGASQLSLDLCCA
jgi:hypothetical protein